VRARTQATVFLIGSLMLGSLLAFQLPFREYAGVEYYGFPTPPDYLQPGEWVFARLMYPPTGYAFRSRFRWGADWANGASSWTIDYPRSDRHVTAAVRRLTRIHARSVEQPVNLDDGDDVFNWPWLYAVEAGHWNLTDQQAKKLREYLLRGGFLMCDDFHGSQEWSVFIASMQRVFPDRPIVEIDRNDPIFHTLWDMNELFQVPGAQFLYTGRVYEWDGVDPHWRAIQDDKGRIMVAICFNMDLGDAWELADRPDYPQPMTALAYRFGINYIVYSMSH
jgi:hypothetical protein